MEELPRLAVARDEMNDEPRAFSNAQRCVVHKRDKQGIPPAEGGREVNSVKDLPELGSGQSEHE